MTTPYGDGFVGAAELPGKPEIDSPITATFPIVTIARAVSGTSRFGQKSTDRILGEADIVRQSRRE
jgi:hypothetical protein